MRNFGLGEQRPRCPSIDSLHFTTLTCAEKTPSAWDAGGAQAASSPLRERSSPCSLTLNLVAGRKASATEMTQRRAPPLTGRLRACTSRRIDDPSDNTTNGTQLQIWDCNGTVQQQYALH